MQYYANWCGAEPYMTKYSAVYQQRPNWGHTVKITSESPVHIVNDNLVFTDSEPYMTWAIENFQARRISYDTWQCASKEEADGLIILFKLKWS